MTELKTWLNSRDRDYKTGLALYRKHGDDGDLLRVLTRQPDAKALARELLALYKRHQKPAAPTVKPVSKRTAKKETTAEAVERLERQWREHFKLMGFYHAQLVQTRPSSVRKRFALATKIVEHDAACKPIWNDLEHFKIHGTLPDRDVHTPEPLADSEDLHRMLKKMHALNSAISYRRGCIETLPANHASIAKHKLALKHNLKEREDLKKQYEEHQGT